MKKPEYKYKIAKVTKSPLPAKAGLQTYAAKITSDETISPMTFYVMARDASEAKNRIDQWIARRRSMKNNPNSGQIASLFL